MRVSEISDEDSLEIEEVGPIGTSRESDRYRIIPLQVQVLAFILICCLLNHGAACEVD